jgi:small GTP-binding protein
MESNAIDSKVVFLGASGVGKTSIICRGVSNEFDIKMAGTVGASYASKLVKLSDGDVNLQIWDTAGQERYRTLAPMYYRGAAFAVIVFSVTQEESFEEVSRWVDEMTKEIDELPILIVVGNKLDLIDERTVAFDRGEDVAKSIGAVAYCEVSAKTGIGIEELFILIAQESAKKIKSPGRAPKIESTLTPLPEHKKTRKGLFAAC